MRSRASILGVPLALVAIATACGGPPTPPPPVPTAAPSASAPASGFAVTPPPSGLPPMAPMPPPGVAGSKKAKKRSDGALYTCGAGQRPAAKDPADLVKRVGEGCATASKMKPLGALIRGTQADKDAHQEHKVRVEANKCYRVYFATDESVRDAVLVMRDSAGDLVGESPGAALPEDGALCFSASDEITLMVAIGSGKGTYAAQVWSD
ncbi:MAG: hypothetical protein JST00_32465 [Deltaproteobacteria bacterium]|nr:hypothetical protein [Deltaproteobacteria bacterium]